MKKNARTFISVISLLFCLSLISSCSEDNSTTNGADGTEGASGTNGTNGSNGATGATGPAGPSLSGQAIGFVTYIYDVNGLSLADKSGVTVSVDGTNISTTTDASGRYVLPLTTGTYNITYSKPSYAISKYIGYQFVGGDNPTVCYGGYLSQIPSFTVSNLSKTTSTGTIDLTATISGTLPTGMRKVRFFVGTSPNVSSNPLNYLYTTDDYVLSTSTSMSTGISTSTLNGYGITKGQTIYIVAYADGYISTSYVDLNTNRQIYTALNLTPSSVISVVVP